MGDIRGSSPDSKVSIDPYALVEALLGQRLEKPESNGLQTGYDDLGVKLQSHRSGGERGEMKPDSPPKDIRVGAVNPYALVEALIGRSIDRNSVTSATIMSNVLQTDYDELFDMQNSSVLYSGLKLNQKERKAEMLSEKDIKILKEEDLITPDLSEAQRVDDLEKIGIKDIGKTRVKTARMQNGKLHLILHADSVGRTVSNRDVTRSINELINPFRLDKGQWTPPNSSWRDMYDQFFQTSAQRLIGNIASFEIDDRKKTLHKFDDPTQGASSNSWLVAALFSVFWSDPNCINRATRVHQARDEKKRLQIRFHDKGGHNNARTETVVVNYEIPINNTNNEPLYCRSSDGADIWPALYEKAFVKWITGNSSEQPDITQAHSGDPVKAMAQINGREPQYFMTEKHSSADLVGLVRRNCLNFKTINPMVAYTYATGGQQDTPYRGSNIVANHAYSVLGYAVLGQKQYIVLRNPWGVTEPIGLTSYPGLLERLDPAQWHPAALLDHGGLFAMEEQSFKHVFCVLGVAK